MSILKLKAFFVSLGLGSFDFLEVSKLGSLFGSPNIAIARHT